MKRNVYLRLTSLEKAKSIWLSKCAGYVIKKEVVSLEKAHGRILAEPVAALLSSPAFHGAAMDGIAVNAADTYGASEIKPKCLIPGKNAFWINTGRPLPEGTNAVIMVEEIFNNNDQTLTIEKAAFPWQHVRKLGEDIVATEILLPAGITVGPYELGAMAAAGVLMPIVYKKPRVAIIPSGSELITLSEATLDIVSSGEKLPEFNSLVLSAMVREAGGEPIVLPIVQDTPSAVIKALKDASEAEFDLIMINAGSSAGSHDYTAPAVSELGEIWVHGVTIMPGKPTLLGIINTTPILGVPGYPVSAAIAFEQFGASLLALWQQRPGKALPCIEALPYKAIPSRPGMEEFIRVKLGMVEGTTVAVPLARGAGTVTTLSRADGIVQISAESEGLPADKPVSVVLLRSLEQIKGALLTIGSHDTLLELLDSMLRKKNTRYSLTSAHVGSLGGLLALKNKRCHLVGCHLLDPSTGVYNQSAVKQHLQGTPVKLVRLVDREQGLILPENNPQNIQGLEDIAIKKINFINRQRGSGTRLLLDHTLATLGIKPDSIIGYENEEYTHMNVAAAVMSGRAGVGLGVRSAANALGLDFISIGVEEYDLVIPTTYWGEERVETLLAVIRSSEFIDRVNSIGGYATEKTGQLIWETNG